MDFKAGASVSSYHIVLESDVTKFADASGDFNPLHMDAEYAHGTKFGQRIVHGAYLNALISALLGNVMPGAGTIYLSQFIEYLAPVHIGDELIIVATVSCRCLPKRRTKILTNVWVGDKQVAEGYAIVQLPRA